MSNTFFFYDLETSGLSARNDRIMQFAGQRTTLDFEPLGEPVNLLIKMSNDTLPSPYAIMVTGITPQATLSDGLTEAEFCKYVQEEIFTPNTISLGYNTIRFDDEFMRHLFWRNFYDPYEWQWQDGRGRWDLLDLVRMTRALRPEGINWPTTNDGQPTNRLELITKLNNIEHENAHDALADVAASIEVAKLLKSKQPQLFDYLFNLRNKREVMKLVNLDHPQPFVYTSGRFGKTHNFTTVAFPLAPAKNGNVLVYDLRHDISESDDQQSFVKTLQYNRCPAVAPLSVLDKNNSWDKLDLTKQGIKDNLTKLLKTPEFAEQVRTNYEERPEFPPAPDPESALYDGFLNDNDRIKCNAVRNASANQLADFHPDFTDERLPELLLHFKARNFKSSLTESESVTWESYRLDRLNRQAPKFVTEITELQKSGADDFLLEELELWYQSLLPEDI